MTKCVDCGNESWNVVSTLGAIEVWRCAVCGHEMTLHVNRPLFKDGVPAGFEKKSAAVGLWLKRPTPQQIEALKKIFPQLSNTSGIELRQKAIDQSAFDLGRMTAVELNQHKQELDELGVEVKLNPL